MLITTAMPCATNAVADCYILFKNKFNALNTLLNSVEHIIQWKEYSCSYAKNLT
jgi:hypothetical protein